MSMITIDRLETSRLILRRPQETDVVPMTALANRREIATRLALMPHPFYECHAAAFIESLATLPQPHGVFAITLKSPDRQLIGMCGYGPRHDNGELDMGYWLGVDYWGKGFATEAASAVVDHAFTVSKVAALPSGYHKDNPASGRVLAKLGFDIVGEEMQESVGTGGLVDTWLLVLLREKWLALQAKKRLALQAER
jgi:RimJ/RimL family protein N-acetyltransferase